MPDAREEAKRWLAQARRDLDDASFASDGGRHHLCCFLCQQAAEKALKAFLYQQGLAVVWGHSVEELLKQAAGYEPRYAALRAGKLDRFYIPTRYPNGLPGGIPSDSFDSEDSEGAVRLAAEVIENVARDVEGEIGA